MLVQIHTSHPIIAEQELFTSIGLFEIMKKNPDFVTYAASLGSYLQRILGRTQQTTNPDPFIRY